MILRDQTALAEREDRFQRLANTIPQLVWLANADGCLFWFNQSWYDYTGCTFEEMKGWGWQSVHYPPTLPEACDRWKAAISEGVALETESMLRRSDGRFGIFLTQILPTRNSEGDVVGWVGSNTDITKFRGAEEGRQRFAALVESSDDAIISKTLDGTITGWNPGAERIFGYPVHEAIAKSMRMLIPPERADEEPDILKRIGQGEKVDHFETVRVRKDGERIDVSVTISPIRDGSGKIIGASTIARDVTSRKRADEALRETKQILDLAQVMVRDLEGRILSWGVGSQALYGYYKEEAIGRISHELLQTQFPEPLEKIEQDLRRDGTWKGELLNCKRDGSHTVVASFWVLHRDAADRPARIVESNADITDLKNSEERLVKLTRELERSNEQLQQFAYVVSHNLQEPLRMVSSYTQLLAKRYTGLLGPEADQVIIPVVDGCNRMQRLIRDLLTYSHAGSGGNVLHEVFAEGALSGALSNLQVLIRDTGAVVTHGPLPVVMTDEAQLKRVFENLVGNAIKYRGAAAPNLYISASKNGDSEWIFSVQDNGIGIPEQYFEAIFVLFQRLHGSRDFEGTGIGLAICKKIIEGLGGRIWVESQPGNGSTFFFSLPEGGPSR